MMRKSTENSKIRKLTNMFNMFIVLLLMGITVACSSKKEEVKTEIDWNTLILKECIPVPETLLGDAGTNLEHALIISLYDVTNEQFNSYVQECIGMGYTIEGEQEDGFYTAFNSEGYEIRLVYQSDKQFNIFLDAPEKMEEFEWPSTGLGIGLPIPKSTYGRICFDDDESFIVHVGNMSIADMTEYINTCKEIGYMDNVTEDDEFFNAFNSKGDELQIMYLGNKNIEISLKITENSMEVSTENISDISSEEFSNKEDDSSSDEFVDEEDHDNLEMSEEVVEGEPDSENDLVNGMRKEFKDSMDSYETFIDEYIEFMKKMSESDDLEILNDYAVLMIKYESATKSFKKWEEEDLNDAEIAYYMQVQNRVNSKLLSIE